MRRLQVSAHLGTDTETVFRITDDLGLDYNLDARGALVVTVEIDGKCIPVPAKITSETDSVRFTQNQLIVRFGALEISPGTYEPSIFYTTVTAPNGIDIVGKGLETVLTLTLSK